MSYFAVLSILYGGLMCAKWPVSVAFPNWSERLITQRAYTEEKPRWLVPVALFGVTLIALTWYMHFTSDVSYSIVITLVITLTVVKLGQLMFNYERFHQWADRMVHIDRRTLDAIHITMLVVGGILIALGIFVY